MFGFRFFLHPKLHVETTVSLTALSAFYLMGGKPSFVFLLLIFHKHKKNVDCTHYVVQTERVRIVFDVEEPFWGICGSLGSFMIWKETRELG